MSDSIVSKNILTIVFTFLIWRGGNLTWGTNRHILICSVIDINGRCLSCIL